MQNLTDPADCRAIGEIKSRFQKLVHRNGGVDQAFQFYSEIVDRLEQSIVKETYIDSFDRDIILDINGSGLARVSISTRINYMKVADGIPFFQTAPRFSSLSQANSYRCSEFILNDVQLTDDVNISHEECNDPNRQLPCIVNVNLPLSWDNPEPRVIYKCKYEVPIDDFFNSYQLVFPCRVMKVSASFTGPGAEYYRPRVATFSSYNVHMYEGYATEVHADLLESITIHNWTLPGSGYVLTAKKQ